MMNLKIFFDLLLFRVVPPVSVKPTTSSVGGSSSSNLPQDNLVLKLNQLEQELASYKAKDEEYWILAKGKQRLVDDPRCLCT